MKITEELLKRTFNTYQPRYGGRKEDYFAPLFIADKFEQDIESVLPYCAYGNYDYGIDGFYIDRNARNLYLYQFKWSTSYELFKESYRRLIKDGIERLFGNPNVDSNANTLVTRIRTELQEFVSVIDRVYICFVFNGDCEKAETSTVLDSLREELESKKHFIDDFFERSGISLAIQYVSNETKGINQVSRTIKTCQYQIDFKSSLRLEAPGGEELHMGFIRLYDLYTMYFEMKQRLFEKNIRAGLSDLLLPNQAIKKSLREIVISGSVSPEYFTFHHNGVTLFAEKLQIVDDIATIVEPRVLNGAQSITTFAKFIEENQKNPQYRANEDRIKDIRVICKIVTRCEKDTITAITISNNKQNPVEAWNLRANDDIQLEFDDKFREDGFFYERQENSFANLTYSDLDELGVAPKEIKIKKLAQTFLAFQGEIGMMASIGKVFESDVIYERTFRKQYLQVATGVIVLAYKIQFRLGSVLREIESSSLTKYSFVRQAKDLVWALLIQAILNDRKSDELLGRYGTSLTVEADFNLLLKEIGTRKIRLLLSDLISQKKYQEFVREEKFSFLKTRTCFQDCMEAAERRYDWKVVMPSDL